MLKVNQVVIGATDGLQLAGTLYQPAEAASKLVLINPATAVRRIYYDKFARFLAERGYTVVTFDYRGVGGSRPERLKGFEATMRDWGEKDLAGVIEWIAREHAPKKLLVVGHSAGGQMVGLAHNNRRIDALLAVAAQDGYYGLWDAPRRYLMAALWHVLVPVATRLVSYFPARRFGLGEDLPAGVALEWARWCRSPDFIVDAAGAPIREHFEGFRGPALAFSFDDDTFAPRRAVEELMSFYRNAKVTLRHVCPQDVGPGIRAIGHFGFFRDNLRSTLWEEALTWLSQQ